MKTPHILVVAALALTSTQCTRKNEVAPSPAKPTYNEVATALMTELAPQVPGDWTMEQVRLKAKEQFMYPTSFSRDTTISQFATLSIIPSRRPRTSPPDVRYPDFDATLTYNGTVYPVRFTLMESGTYILRKEGPPAYFLLEFNYPDGVHQTTPEEQFLQDLLIGDSYSLTIDKGRTIMVWEGNRHARRIELRK